MKSEEEKLSLEVEKPVMSFFLYKEQKERLDEWKKAIKLLHGEYGTFDYIFTPTGIGDGVTVYSHLAKVSIDLTDVEKW